MSLTPAFKALVEQEINQYLNSTPQPKAEIIAALSSFELPASLKSSIHKQRRQNISDEYQDLIDGIWRLQRASDLKQLEGLSIDEAKKILPMKIDKLDTRIAGKKTLLTNLKTEGEALVSHFNRGDYPDKFNIYSLDLSRESVLSDLSGFDDDLRLPLRYLLANAFEYSFTLDMYLISNSANLYLLHRKMYWANAIQQFRDQDEVRKVSRQVQQLEDERRQLQEIYARISLSDTATAGEKIAVLDSYHAQVLEVQKDALLKKYGPETLGSREQEELTCLFADCLIPKLGEESDYQAAIKAYRETLAKMTCLRRHQGELLGELDKIIPGIHGHGPAIFSSKKVIRRDLEALRERMSELEVNKDTGYEAFENELAAWQREVKRDLKVGWGPIGLLIKLIRSSGPERAREIYEDLVASSAACPAP